MNNLDDLEEYKNVLLEIAREVYSRVFGDNKDRNLLRQLRKALRDLANQCKKHREYMKEQPSISSNMQIPDECEDPAYKYFHVDKTRTFPLKKVPSNIFCPDGIPGKITKKLTELNKREAKERNLIGLACIYDNCRVRIGRQTKINNSIVPENVYRYIWWSISSEAAFFEGRVELWKNALESICRKSKRVETEQNKGEQDEKQKKITKLTDFIRDNCEDTTSISSKVNRIHELVKKCKIKFMPKPVNKPKRNQTKLYVEEELRQIWPKLKEKIVSLPNLKD